MDVSYFLLFTSMQSVFVHIIRVLIFRVDLLCIIDDFECFDNQEIRSIIVTENCILVYNFATWYSLVCYVSCFGYKKLKVICGFYMCLNRLRRLSQPLHSDENINWPNCSNSIYLAFNRTIPNQEITSCQIKDQLMDNGITLDLLRNVHLITIVRRCGWLC